MKKSVINTDFFNYLSKLLGILGSSINNRRHALLPAEAEREPIQDSNDANI